jgi:hypothetical protein
MGLLGHLQNKPLQKRQKNANKNKSRFRVRVVDIYAFMEQFKIGMYIHYRTLIRVTARIGLINITYNLLWPVQLDDTL